jgi:hypothetical protein
MLLAQTVAVSFAMNLFFIAILLTPVTSQQEPTSTKPSTITRLPNSVQPAMRRLQAFIAAKPAAYRPHPLLYLIPLLACYTGVFLLPFSTLTPTFMTTLLIPHVVLFQPLFVDHLIFGFWDRLPGSRSPRVLYRFMAYCSIALHIKQAVVALLDNDPGAHSHKHSALLQYLYLGNPGYHGPIERSATALGRVFGSLGDHPAVASVGWDVMLCGLSLIAWAVVRGLDVVKITGNAGLNKIPGDSTASRDSKGVEEEPARPGSQASIISKTAKSNEGTRRRRVASASDEDENVAQSSMKVATGEEEVPENAESGAVSWGLFVVGGLGAIASGVLGAEVERF